MLVHACLRHGSTQVVVLARLARRAATAGRGQTLRTVATPDVAAKIARVAGTADHAALTSREVLQWVMENTVQATLRGVLEWSQQGLVYAATVNAPDRVVQPELLDLSALYGAARVRVPVHALLAAKQAQWKREDLAPQLAQLMGDVTALGTEMGAEHHATAHRALGEECERELEREEEKEEEAEVQTARVVPAAEVDWEYAAAAQAPALAPAELQRLGGVELLPLAAVAKELAAEGVAELPWSDEVFATPNFVRAVEVGEGQPLDEYLRTPDTALVCAGRAIVLVSEREADGLLRCGATVAHVTYAWSAQQQQEQEQGGTSAPLGHAGPAVGEAAAALRPALASELLFNGETVFVRPGNGSGVRESAQLALLRALVGGRAAAARAIVAARGKQALFARSQLELACDG